MGVREIIPSSAKERTNNGPEMDKYCTRNHEDQVCLCVFLGKDKGEKKKHEVLSILPFFFFNHFLAP